MKKKKHRRPKFIKISDTDRVDYMWAGRVCSVKTSKIVDGVRVYVVDHLEMPFEVEEQYTEKPSGLEVMVYASRVAELEAIHDNWNAQMKQIDELNQDVRKGDTVLVTESSIEHLRDELLSDWRNPSLEPEDEEAEMKADDDSREAALVVPWKWHNQFNWVEARVVTPPSHEGGAFLVRIAHGPLCNHVKSCADWLADRPDHQRAGVIIDWYGLRPINAGTPST